MRRGIKLTLSSALSKKCLRCISAWLTGVAFSLSHYWGLCSTCEYCGSSSRGGTRRSTRRSSTRRTFHRFSIFWFQKSTFQGIFDIGHALAYIAADLISFDGVLGEAARSSGENRRIRRNHFLAFPRRHCPRTVLLRLSLLFRHGPGARNHCTECESLPCHLPCDIAHLLGVYSRSPRELAYFQLLDRRPLWKIVFVQSALPLLAVTFMLAQPLMTFAEKPNGAIERRVDNASLGVSLDFLRRNSRL